MRSRFFKGRSRSGQIQEASAKCRAVWGFPDAGTPSFKRSHAIVPSPNRSLPSVQAKPNLNPSALNQQQKVLYTAAPIALNPIRLISAATPKLKQGRTDNNKCVVL